MAVRNSAAAFHLPSDVSKPVVLFCAGSGIAPMRGFMQERSAQAAALSGGGGGQTVGKIYLFFGCRDPEKDYLYSEGDLKAWVDQGILEIYPAFSQATHVSDGCRYVQE